MLGFSDDLARPLGCSEVGPVEPPEVIRPRRSGPRWIALGVFASLAATAILMAGGPAPSATSLDKVWQAEVPDDREKPKDAGLPSEEVYAIQIDGLPAIGRADAKVTLVVVTDYACTTCESARPMIQSLRGAYGADLRVVWKPRARNGDGDPSLAGACAAALQGELERYDEAAWRVGVEKSRQLGLPIALPQSGQVTRIARELGLDMTRFASAMRRCDAVVKTSTRELAGLGVGAPAYFVNGRVVDPWGTDAIATFESLIDTELAKAKRRIAEGATADRYYRTWVLDAGRTER